MFSSPPGLQSHRFQFAPSLASHHGFRHPRMGAERSASRPLLRHRHDPVQSPAKALRSRQNFTRFPQPTHRLPPRERIQRCCSKFARQESGLVRQLSGQCEPSAPFLSVPRSPPAQILCNISDPNSVSFREPLDELRRICGIKNVLPNTCTLSDSLLGCVYEGTFNGSKVRIRRVRTHSKGDPQKAKEVCLRWHNFPLPDAHGLDRSFTKLLWSGSTWRIRISSPFWVLLLIRLN